MTLQQLSRVKQWHLDHPRGHGVEQQVWDGVLTAWLAGWIGLGVAWLLHSPAMAVGCGLLIAAPGLYLLVRRHLHRRSTLRCDWLSSVR